LGISFNLTDKDDKKIGFGVSAIREKDIPLKGAEKLQNRMSGNFDLLLKLNKNVSFSTSNSYQPNEGCDGGLMEYVFEYAKTHPVPLESEFPYRNSEHQCPQRELTRVKVDNYKVLTRLEKADADKWAREAEVKIEKGLYEDLSQANTITVKELLQTYYKDVTITKLGVNEEKYKIDKLCRQPIANLKLARLTPLQVRNFQDACLLIYNPSTINKYITLISVAVKHARQMLGIYLPNNPCDFVKRLKEPEFKADIIEEQEELLLLTESEKSKANWLKLAK
jgi:hypothetical protein